LLVFTFLGQALSCKPGPLVRVIVCQSVSQSVSRFVCLSVCLSVTDVLWLTGIGIRRKLLTRMIILVKSNLSMPNLDDAVQGKHFQIWG